jgi:hypothetical protein
VAERCSRCHPDAPNSNGCASCNPERLGERLTAALARITDLEATLAKQRKEHTEEIRQLERDARDAVREAATEAAREAEQQRRGFLW